MPERNLRGTCGLCNKDYELLKEGVLVNPGCVSGSIFEIKFSAGKYSEQIFFLDIKQAYTCYACLESAVDAGKGKKKPLSTCYKCHKVYGDMHGWDGLTLPENRIEQSWYGSRHDEDWHQYTALTPSQWYCYACLDTEIDEGRTKKLNGTIKMNEISAYRKKIEQEIATAAATEFSHPHYDKLMQHCYQCNTCWPKESQYFWAVKNLCLEGLDLHKNYLDAKERID